MGSPPLARVQKIGRVKWKLPRFDPVLAQASQSQFFTSEQFGTDMTVRTRHDLLVHVCRGSHDRQFIALILESLRVQVSRKKEQT